MKYEAEQVEMIEHANAITIHKSQGSECQVVIIPWLKAFYPMLKRNIFYTGITRAKQRFILLGNGKPFVRQSTQMIREQKDDAGSKNTTVL